MSSNTKPNILFIMCDQMKATASHLYGNTFCETPSLERLAKRGVLYEHAVTPHPLCVPARISTWTSQWPHSHGGRRNQTLMPADAVHAFKIWKQEGFHTGLIGKNHCFEAESDLALFDTWCQISHGGLTQGEATKGMDWFRSIGQINAGHRVRKNMPPYVAIPAKTGFSGGTGYLSSKFGVFELNADPGGRGEFKVKDLSISSSVSTRQFERRMKARAILESRLKNQNVDTNQLGTMNQFYQQAFTLLNSAEAQKAFTLEGETSETKDLYGHGYVLSYRNQPAAVGGRLMMARRLVAAGVRFVSVDYGGWDNHTSIRNAYLDKGPALDHAIAGLITDLDQRGMLDDTLVMVTTEFGRTPRINTSSGRDHWARSYSMMLAGGGITRGQIYGASDATASQPDKNPVPLEDFLCTIYHQLGIDSNKELLAFGTRPIEIVKGGKIVKGLIA